MTKAAADASGFVHPLGIPVRAGSFFPYVVSLSVLLQVFFLPLLGAFADYSRRKKQLLLVFAYLGSLATMGLYFLEGTAYLLGGTLFLVANLAFGASVVLYNAYLPELASPDERDGVSSTGWALGYVGGGLLLAVNVVLFSRASTFGLSTADAVRISLASAGAWWALFTLVPATTLRVRAPARALPPGERMLTVGFRQLAATLRAAPRLPRTLLFLAAFLVYNDGVQTVIALSSQFGQEELGIPISTLTLVILMVQFVAFGGALGMGWLAGRIGAKAAVLASLIVWCATVVYAYGFLFTTAQFFVLAAVIGVVLGGTQALSRSLFSHMIPAGQEAEYYGLYEVSERGTSWLGPLVFGLALQFTGSYRVAILSLIAFFAVGLFLLARVDVRRAALEAGNPAPVKT